MKKWKAVIVLLVICTAFVMGCANKENKEYSKDSITPGKDVIRPEGMTLEERFAEPEGFPRVEDEAGSLTEFLREYPLKEDGSPVLLYDGTKKGNQRAHAAVFALLIENEDLQQCADSNLCENAQGERAFLLAQGYMPAQEFHVLKNPPHEDDPWYYMDEVCFPLKTPEYTFEEGSLRRLGY